MWNIVQIDKSNSELSQVGYVTKGYHKIARRSRESKSIFVQVGRALKSHSPCYVGLVKLTAQGLEGYGLHHCDRRVKVIGGDHATAWWQPATSRH